MNTNRFTYNGKLHILLPLQTFNSGFKKREFVCKVEGGKYTDYAVFTAKKETCDKIATLKPGDDVAVEFVLDAHEWEGPKGTRWFGGATALKVELAGGSVAGGPETAEPEAEPEQGDLGIDDLPF